MWQNQAQTKIQNPHLAMKVVEGAKFCVVVLKVCKLTFLRKVNTYEVVNLVNLILPNLYK